MEKNKYVTENKIKQVSNPYLLQKKLNTGQPDYKFDTDLVVKRGISQNSLKKGWILLIAKNGTFYLQFTGREFKIK